MLGAALRSRYCGQGQQERKLCRYAFARPSGPAEFELEQAWAVLGARGKVMNEHAISVSFQVLRKKRSGGLFDDVNVRLVGDDVVAQSVCRHAVKANDPLRYLEVEKLIQDLLGCDLPYCCPHGRPTMIQISNAELEKKFGRKV